MIKFDKKLIAFCLILVAFGGVYGMESNHSQNFYGAMESKIESFSDLISFEPQSISTDCNQINEKYEEYAEAMAFSHGINDEMMTETMLK